MILRDLFHPNHKESEEMVENQSAKWTHLFIRNIFPKQMHDLRDIVVSLQGKVQVEKIISDAQTVHSLYKYMRKVRAKDIEEFERSIFILSFLYIISFLNLFFLLKFSNGWLESLGEWTSIFEKKYLI
jgi:hypothetical protein